jgi:hypothetical protein
MGYGPGMEVPFYPRVRGFGNAAPTTQAIPERAHAFPPPWGRTGAQVRRNRAAASDAGRLPVATRL